MIAAWIDGARLDALLSVVPPAWGAAGSGVLGAIVGSHMATIVLRWPRGQGAMAGRSRCDACAAPLRWFELAPILSAAVQRGRCRRCGATIASLHGATEIAAAGIGIAAMLLVGGSGGVAIAVMGWLLLPLALLDARHLWLPVGLVAALAGAGLLLAGWLGLAPLSDRLVGGAGGFAALWAIATGFRLATGREGMGGGDARLFGAIGLWTGWLLLPTILLGACLIGFADAAARMLLRRPAVQLPLGTYLAVAAFAAALSAATGSAIN